MDGEALLDGHVSCRVLLHLSLLAEKKYHSLQISLSSLFTQFHGSSKHLIIIITDNCINCSMYIIILWTSSIISIISIIILVLFCIIFVCCSVPSSCISCCYTCSCALTRVS